MQTSRNHGSDPPPLEPDPVLVGGGAGVAAVRNRTVAVDAAAVQDQRADGLAAPENC